jgi:hypothetical protein
MRILAGLLRALGYIWGAGFALVVVVGTAVYIYNAPSKWEAIRTVQAEWSPFNLFGWLTNLLLLSPALIAVALSNWIRARESRS